MTTRPDAGRVETLGTIDYGTYPAGAVEWEKACIRWYRTGCAKNDVCGIRSTAECDRTNQQLQATCRTDHAGCSNVDATDFERCSMRIAQESCADYCPPEQQACFNFCFVDCLD